MPPRTRSSRTALLASEKLPEARAALDAALKVQPANALARARPRACARSDQRARPGDALTAYAALDKIAIVREHQPPGAARQSTGWRPKLGRTADAASAKLAAAQDQRGAKHPVSRRIVDGERQPPARNSWQIRASLRWHAGCLVRWAGGNQPCPRIRFEIDQFRPARDHHRRAGDDETIKGATRAATCRHSAPPSAPSMGPRARSSAPASGDARRLRPRACFLVIVASIAGACSRTSTQAELDSETEELWGLFDVVNCACGGHAGDATSMARVAAILAHTSGSSRAPSYADSRTLRPRSLANRTVVLAASSSMGADAAHSATWPSAHGVVVRSIKPHGALYHDAASSDSIGAER